jgi:hypothetical protein
MMWPSAAVMVLMRVAQNGMAICRVERRRLLRQVHEAVSKCIDTAVKARSEREKVSKSALWVGMLLPFNSVAAH